jgi:hypothetical protein
VWSRNQWPLAIAEFSERFRSLLHDEHENAGLHRQRERVVSMYTSYVKTLALLELIEHIPRMPCMHAEASTLS